MCIIVAKEKGKQLPSKKTLETCFTRNKDGAGFMYVKNNQVIIDKGYMTFEDFYNRLKELKKEFNSDLTDKALVMHFRIGTHGENDKYTTHPFPITNNKDELRKTKTTCSVGMAHNGIISEYNYDKILSDTQSFIKDCISVYKSYNRYFYKDNRIMTILEKSINGSRLCFLDNKENIYYVGNFVEDNGIMYSNSTYKPYEYTTYSNYNYNRDYDDYNYTSDIESKGTTNIFDEYETDITTFVETHKDYDILEVGDQYMLDDYIYEVYEGDYLLLDDKDNLYEYFDGVVSLIGTNVAVYDKNFNQKVVA